MSAKIIYRRRNRTTKKIANMTANAAFYGVSIAGYATKTSSTATVAALATGAAVGATGIGLLVGTAALYGGYAIQAGISAKKTNTHINNLKQILADASQYSCTCKTSHDHTMLVHTILPYIIQKKRTKLHRKVAVASTVGMYSNIEAPRAALKKIYKVCTRTAGKNRRYYATILARHFLRGGCLLADSIVGELYSEAEMDMMTELDHDVVVELLMDKMKSV